MENDLINVFPVPADTNNRLQENLAANKAAGPDGIGTSELRFAAADSVQSLAVLLNESSATGMLSIGFKMATICPLLKSGKEDSSLPENYRGISLTSTISKLL